MNANPPLPRTASAQSFSRRDRFVAILAACSALAALAPEAYGAAPDPPAVRMLDDYDVVIAGGTTAALAAALAAHDEGARVALLEPTDWIGGQLTASAVPAVDEAWHKVRDPQTDEVLVDVAGIARDPRNMTPVFRDMLAQVGNPGRGWVSRYCFEPLDLLRNHLQPLIDVRRDRLDVYLNTVVKRVETDGDAIVSLTAIRRTPRAGVTAEGYDLLLSQDLAEWYSPADSARFTKEVLRFAARANSPAATVFLEATEWGDLFVLADAPYRQGCEPAEDAPDFDDTCGQATVFDFVEEFHAKPTDDDAPDPRIDGMGFGDYAERADAWNQIWTYRRIRGAAAAPGPGDLCLQNWGYSRRRAEGGNDYPFGYLFLSAKLAAAQRDDWQGGLDMSVLAAAEQRAFAWHQWFRRRAPAGIDPRQITLSRTVLGTGHGLAKLPYIRDTRRSVGLDGFVITYDDLAPPPQHGTGTRFPDRVALGAYAGDIHPLATCEYPQFDEHLRPTLPFYIPFRALTNAKYGNLLAAGKTMAQTFAANSAIRLHPIEWSSGTAAGVAAAMMAREGCDSRAALAAIDRLQQRVKKFTPIDYALDGHPAGSRP
ncbi:MAG: FAD-dependent oxidoreductase [Pirellulales bacterium]|nr:FAD-dependent oxidoreductase [Pirellulales bacterium]